MGLPTFRSLGKEKNLAKEQIGEKPGKYGVPKPREENVSRRGAQHY